MHSSPGEQRFSFQPVQYKLAVTEKQDVRELFTKW